MKIKSNGLLVESCFGVFVGANELRVVEDAVVVFVVVLYQLVDQVWKRKCSQIIRTRRMEAKGVGLDE